jgi:hypothetical protein
MRRDLERRLARLEQGQGAGHILRTIRVTDYIDEARRKALAPGERIVLDWYSDVDFGVLARERITTDPVDEGHRCEGHPPLPPGYTDLPHLIVFRRMDDP